MTFLFITHHLQEVYEICDTVTVFRDARHILTAPVAELATDRAGRGDDRRGRRGLGTGRHRAAAGDARRCCASLALRRDGVPSRRRFTVRAGEVVGLAGGGGSGKLAVAETHRRAAPAAGGHASRSAAGGRSPAACRRRWRPASASCRRTATARASSRCSSIAENITMTVPRPARAGAASSTRAGATRVARALIERARRQDRRARTSRSPSLSGGNQQKVVMARALANEPRVLVLIAPDRRRRRAVQGDAARRRRRRPRARGTGVLVVSDELDDLRDCDRVLVMFQRPRRRASSPAAGATTTWSPRWKGSTAMS